MYILQISSLSFLLPYCVATSDSLCGYKTCTCDHEAARCFSRHEYNETFKDVDEERCQTSKAS